MTTERAGLDWLAADADPSALAVDAIAGFRFRTRLLSGALDVQSPRVVCLVTMVRDAVDVANALKANDGPIDQL